MMPYWLPVVVERAGRTTIKTPWYIICCVAGCPRYRSVRLIVSQATRPTAADGARTALRDVETQTVTRTTYFEILTSGRDDIPGDVRTCERCKKNLLTSLYYCL